MAQEGRWEGRKGWERSALGERSVRRRKLAGRSEGGIEGEKGRKGSERDGAVGRSVGRRKAEGEHGRNYDLGITKKGLNLRKEGEERFEEERIRGKGRERRRLRMRREGIEVWAVRRRN